MQLARVLRPGGRLALLTWAVRARTHESDDEDQREPFHGQDSFTAMLCTTSATKRSMSAWLPETMMRSWLETIVSGVA